MSKGGVGGEGTEVHLASAGGEASFGEGRTQLGHGELLGLPVLLHLLVRKSIYITTTTATINTAPSAWSRPKPVA